LRGGRPWGAGAPADVVIREGVIERIGPGLRADPAAEVVDVPGRLLLPGLIDAHCHVDKTLFGGRWVPHSAGPALVRCPHTLAGSPSTIRAGSSVWATR
jgi:cytosine/creatinine deaminase